MGRRAVWGFLAMVASGGFCGAETLLESARLPDYSYAGYHDGERAVPEVAVAGNVKEHGAKGDGVSDDAPAFRAAIAATDHGAILIPAGRYVLGSVVTIDKPNVVLRGEGEGKTILVIPRSLQQLRPVGFRDGQKLSYSFGGGFITVKGPYGGEKLGEVAGEGKRGDRMLELSRETGLKKGDAIRLLMNNAGSLGRYLHGELFDAGTDTVTYRNYVDFAAHVVAVEGRKVTLDRPLRTDIRSDWRPEVWSYRPRIVEAGVENLSFEFPGVPKKKHLQEEGFNAIHMINAVNCWVRNVTITDADLGVKLDSCRNCTVSHVTINANKRKDPTGHHAFWASGHSQDNLFTDFAVNTRFVHDLSVEGFANGNVFQHGRGVALNLDHHRNAPYGNLFTDLHTGDVSRLWESSGREDRGPHSAGWETVWGVTYDKGKLPGLPDWPLLNVVGVKGYSAVRPAGNTPWVEPLEGAVTPSNLYIYQFNRRLEAGKSGGGR